MREKRARFIQKNNELCQEFSYADPITKIKLNSMYNSHFTGSPLWDLFCREAETIYKTWNVATRKMFNLHHSTHRYFIEPLSETRHIKLALIKRFIKFTQNITNSTKTQMRTLYNCIRKDCNSITGNNLRRIMILLGVDSIDRITMTSLEKIKYCCFRRAILKVIHVYIDHLLLSTISSISSYITLTDNVVSVFSQNSPIHKSQCEIHWQLIFFYMLPSDIVYSSFFNCLQIIALLSNSD